MKRFKEYQIYFEGLKEGWHKFEFNLDDSFFELFEDSEIKKGKLKSFINLERRPDMLTFLIEFKGIVNVTCDICLEDFNMEIKGNFELFVKFGEEYSEIDDNVIILSKNEDNINIAQYLYEYLHLSLPISKNHTDNGTGEEECNNDAVERLNKFLVQEQEDNKEIDPRWDKLKDIKLD